MRGTLHLLACDDLPWLLPLLAPVFVAHDQRRCAELGLQDGEPTYVLLKDWVEQEHSSGSWSDVAAHAELTLRYLSAYGPATPHDQAAWSGMPMSQIRAAWHHLADDLLEVEVAGAPSWMLKTDATRLKEPPASTPIARLLPSFDTYLLGYQKRDLTVSPQDAKRINAGGGLLRPTLISDGRAMGTWKSTQQKKRLEVQVEPFAPLAPEVSMGVEAEVSDLARFLETSARLRMYSENKVLHLIK